MPQAAKGQAADVYHVDGIRAAVQINVDEWGVPHIFATNTDDVFFAQGWNVARDRLFQIDLWRGWPNGDASNSTSRPPIPGTAFAPSFKTEEPQGPVESRT